MANSQRHTVCFLEPALELKYAPPETPGRFRLDEVQEMVYNCENYPQGVQDEQGHTIP
jgi:hypothetical protein